jgi:protein O-mannosyl-transferase
MKHKTILWQIILICIACFIVYSNNFKHDFHLDSWHTIESNTYVRSLKYIPKYFVDAKTSSCLNSNLLYRPVLYITYAINYSISKYNTWSWHLFQILFHLAVALGLYFFSKEIINIFYTDRKYSFKKFTPFFIALIFAIHPAGSGIVNYLTARSSLLVAAFLMPSFVFYLKNIQAKKTYAIVPIVLYTLALFTKVEAIGALAVYYLLEVLIFAKKNEKKKNLFLDVYGSINKQVILRLAPFFFISTIYFVIRANVLPAYVAGARHNPGITPFYYLITQFTTWWHYIYSWFIPTNLIADNMVYPIYKSIVQPQVLLAISGWLLVIYILIRNYRKQPVFTIIAISSLALISPTSSIVPLAEMVNEHRPYLPIALLSITWLLFFFDILFANQKPKRIRDYILFCALILYLGSLSVITYQRNAVFKTAETYWKDVVTKAPAARSCLNYGRIFMNRRDYKSAFDYYNQALGYAPNWHFIHVNLGVLYEKQGNFEKALETYSKGVRCEPLTHLNMKNRGLLYLKQKKYRLALDDLEKSLSTVQNPFLIYKGMASAYSGLGYWQKSYEYTKKCFDIDPDKTNLSIIDIANPYWDKPSLYKSGINYFNAMKKLYPNIWWIQKNINSLSKKIEFQNR